MANFRFVEGCMEKVNMGYDKEKAVESTVRELFTGQSTAIPVRCFYFFHIIRLLSTPLSLTWIMTFLLKVLIINILSIFIPLYTLQRLHNTTKRTEKMNIFIAEETAFGLELKLFQWWLGCGRYRVPYVKFLCLWFIRSSPVWLTSYFFNKKLG